jgi:aspartyl-tRNA synthetase
LIGWIQSLRDHGCLLFIDLRDREGITQLVFDPKNKNYETLLPNLREESVIEITGTVNTGVVGSYRVLYKIADEAGNIATEVRTVNVVESGS